MADFLGKKIIGTKLGDNPIVQDDPKILMHAFDDVIANGYKKLKFQCYAPYFNDGDACVWGTHGLYVLPNEKRDVEKNYIYIEIPSKKDIKVHEEILAHMLDSGNHNAVLYEAFGDHAQVTYDGEEFKIEEYGHD